MGQPTRLGAGGSCLSSRYVVSFLLLLSYNICQSLDCVLAFLKFLEGKDFFIQFFLGCRGGSSYRSFGLLVGFVGLRYVLTPVHWLFSFSSLVFLNSVHLQVGQTS